MHGRGGIDVWREQRIAYSVHMPMHGVNGKFGQWVIGNRAVRIPIVPLGSAEE